VGKKKGGRWRIGKIKGPEISLPSGGGIRGHPRLHKMKGKEEDWDAPRTICYGMEKKRASSKDSSI